MEFSRRARFLVETGLVLAVWGVFLSLGAVAEVDVIPRRAEAAPRQPAPPAGQSPLSAVPG